MSVVAGTWSIAAVVTPRAAHRPVAAHDHGVRGRPALDGHRGECHVRGEPRTGSRPRCSSTTIPKPPAGRSSTGAASSPHRPTSEGRAPSTTPSSTARRRTRGPGPGFYGISAQPRPGRSRPCRPRGCRLRAPTARLQPRRGRRDPETRAADRWWGAQRLLVADVRGRARHAHRDPGCRGDGGAGSRARRGRRHRRVSQTSTRPWTAPRGWPVRYLPNAEHAAVYGRRFEMYTQLVDAMGPFWRRLGTAADGPAA